jgi:uncharacterized protein involved in response to NO
MKPAHGLARIPFLSYGFRPFFFGGALWSACAMPLWIGLMTGKISFAESYGAAAWHAHEFLFGYVPPIMAGFLFTAIPNWTGRLPMRGGPLLSLYSLWLAGRAALLTVDQIGLLPAIIVDSLFLPVLAIIVLREIVAGRDRRNIKIAVLVAILAVANIFYHVEIFDTGVSAYGSRVATATIVGLIMLVGGRITPSFTRNWLAKRASGRLPVPFGRYDMIANAIGGLALFAWIMLPEARVTSTVLIAAAVLHAYRLYRWAGLPTWREPLVLILHIGYAFVPLGFVLTGASVLCPTAVPANAALHAWTAGAMGVMTLSVMTRATLGHTGRELTATAPTQTIYAFVILAAIARIAVPFFVAWSMPILTLAAVAWTASFAIYAAVYGPMLCRARIAAR